MSGCPQSCDCCSFPSRVQTLKSGLFSYFSGEILVVLRSARNPYRQYFSCPTHVGLGSSPGSLCSPARSKSLDSDGSQPWLRASPRLHADELSPHGSLSCIYQLTSRISQSSDWMNLGVLTTPVRISPRSEDFSLDQTVPPSLRYLERPHSVALAWLSRSTQVIRLQCCLHNSALSLHSSWPC